MCVCVPGQTYIGYHLQYLCGHADFARYSLACLVVGLMIAKLSLIQSKGEYVCRRIHNRVHSGSSNTEDRLLLEALCLNLSWYKLHWILVGMIIRFIP